MADRDGRCCSVTAEDGDAQARRVGEAETVRAGFDELPIPVVLLEGPDYRFVGANAAYRSTTGREDLVGLSAREAFGEIEGQQLFELLDRVYASGEAVTAHEWRVQYDRGDGVTPDVYLDFSVLPRRRADSTVYGLLIQQEDVTERVLARRTAERHASEAQRRYEAARDVVVELQQALLPTGLPVLPRARIAARYLVATQDQAAGGDWFDAIALQDGRVVLVVGDVLGHGVTASAAMGQLRAVLDDRLTTEPDLTTALAHVDAFAARVPALQAATLCVAVLDPATGALSYACLGHPPPLVIAAGDGATRFLADTGTGPLATGQTPAVASDELEPDELVFLYSDGLIERPARSLQQGMAELATVAGDAAAGRALPAGAASPPADRVCQLTVELLTRTGYADDVTALAAHRRPEPIGPLELALPAELESLALARRELAAWLAIVNPAREDRQSLELAVSEAVTNTIEHAYPEGKSGVVEVTAELRPDGCVEVRVSDRGRWQAPAHGAQNRGRGLVMAEKLLDSLAVTHPPQEAGGPAGARGTTVTLVHLVQREAVLASAPSATAAEHASQPSFNVEADTAAETPSLRVAGPVDASTAERLSARALTAARGGVLPLTIDLSAVTHLASAGVQTLHELRDQLETHRCALTLVAPSGGPAQLVLDLVHLPYRTAGAEAAGEGA
jgi:serine phosphatase RsbU (regulator of sigma subunit)/anti-sigma regulatory factor (Ser/Thr protein kinase)/anti-anti-sigma regulatory factor